MECRATEMGQAAQVELAAAEAAVRALGLNPGTAGFFAAHGARRDAGGKPGAYTFTGRQQEALARYQAAKKAVRAAHDDYVIGGLRREIQAERERRQQMESR